MIDHRQIVLPVLLLFVAGHLALAPSAEAQYSPGGEWSQWGAEGQEGWGRDRGYYRDEKSGTAIDRELPEWAAQFAEANQRVEVLRDRRDRLQRQLDMLRGQLRREQESSPELERQQQEVSRLRTQYRQAREEALQPLQNNQQYQQLQQRADELDDRIWQMQQNGAPQSEITELSNELLDIQDRITSMEADRLDQAPQVQQLQDELMTAYNELTQMQDRNNTAINENPQVNSLQERLADVRQDLDQALITLSSSRAGYREARLQDAQQGRDYDYYPYVYSWFW